MDLSQLKFLWRLKARHDLKISTLQKLESLSSVEALFILIFVFQKHLPLLFGESNQKPIALMNFLLLLCQFVTIFPFLHNFTNFTFWYLFVLLETEPIIPTQPTPVNLCQFNFLFECLNLNYQVDFPILEQQSVLIARFILHFPQFVPHSPPLLLHSQLHSYLLN